MGALQPVTGANFTQALCPGVAGGDLRAKVAFAFIRRAYVVEQ